MKEKRSGKYSLDNTMVGDSWRMFRIMGEFAEGLEAMSVIEGVGVTIFGSARTSADDKYYKDAVTIGRLCAEKGWAVITGGGPGIMEAANKGAFLADGLSIGLNIDLPHEQAANKYVNHLVDFDYFFIRKVMLAKYSQGFVCMPGGVGTMDELFEAVTLIQTGRMEPFPIILYGSEYWNGLIDWLRNTMAVEKKINEEDLDLFTVLDDPQDVVSYLEEKINSFKN